MKRVIIIFLAFFYISSLLLVSGAGVTPSSYNIDFEPNLKKEFSFTFIFPPYTKSDVYISGRLSEYAKILNEQKDLANGRKRVIVELDLPEKVDTPGLNIIRVGAIEDLGADSGISIGSDVGGLIRVRVPYPGKYAEIKLQTSNVNAGEKVPYELTVYSRGDETINIKTQLEITNEKGVIEIINLQNRIIPSKNNTVYKGLIDTTNLNPGDYNLTAKVDYEGEKQAITTSLFRLGELNVRLVNYTKEITTGKINRFEIEIESLWNDPMKEVYSEMTIIGYPESFMQTPSIHLTPWKKTKLLGHIDATEIKADVVLGEITIFYQGEEKTEIVEINILKPINWTLVLIIGGGIFITLIIVLMFIIIIYLLMKRKKQ